MLTGRSIVELQQGRKNTLRYNVSAFILDLASDILKERIAKRAKQMLDSGWIEEAENAINRGLFSTPTAHQALGYRQIADYLDGKTGKDELFQKICTATWQYARRQRTWFRHQHPEAEKYTGGVENLLLRATL